MRVVSTRWLAPVWLVLALFPWWLGLPLLLAVVAALLLIGERLHLHAASLRSGLRWGLPGVLLAVQRALGGGAFAWAMALLGVLVGYTLLAGLEAWLDRDRPHGTPATVEWRDWPSLAMDPVGPTHVLIELQPPQWCEGCCADPRGGQVRWSVGGFVFADGARLDRVEPRACFSPEGGWFAARWVQSTVLLERDTGRAHRLRGWELCGWHEGPWLARRSGPAMAWWEVLGQRGH